MVDAGVYSNSGRAGAVPEMNFEEQLQLYPASTFGADRLRLTETFGSFRVTGSWHRISRCV